MEPVAGAGLVDDRLGLLAHELLDVVEPAAGLAGRARTLPATERLDAWPRTGGRACASVHVDDAAMNVVQQLALLRLVLTVEARGQGVFGLVGELDALVDRVDRRNRHERHEE